MLDHSTQAGRAPLKERRGDCYDTPAVAVLALLDLEMIPRTIWEPACGTGNIVKVLRQHGRAVIATDLNDRGCPNSEARIDFLLPGMTVDVDAIITNPPFALAEQFVSTALDRCPFVIMLLRLAFLESEKRAHILDKAGLARVHLFSRRLPMMHRAGWTGPRASSSIPFAWFVWERGHHGKTTIDRVDWRDYAGAG